MASTYLTKTLGTPTNSYKGTISFWYKKSQPVVSGGNQGLFGACNLGVTANTYGFLNQYNDSLYLYDNANSVILNTNRLFRDCNSFYHIVYAWDTTQATSSNRIKLYVNGVQETSFATANYPAQNSSLQISTSGRTFGIGAFSTSTGGFSGFFDGAMSHFNYVDGTAYDASAFGETDATTGEWKGKTSPSVTYGNNGFFILKDGNGITDQSGEGNNFTLGGGTLTDLKDNPDNVFATWNALIPDVATLSNGNTTSSNTSSSNWNRASCTLADTKGKYYAEFKMTTQEASQVGIIDVDQAYGTTAQPRNSSRAYMYKENGQKGNNSSDSNYGDTYTDGDIIGVAVDLDNNKIYFSKNGVFQNSGVPTSGSTGTGSAFNLTDGYFYTFINGNYDSSGNGRIDANFGNGYFGTTAITTNSGNGYSGAEGSSKFNYTVPTGYSALSTKGLNE